VAIVYLGLGANLGDRLSNLRAALVELAKHGEVVACSSVYETSPWGVADQPPFLNMCGVLHTILDPEELLVACKAIEQRLGRRPGRRWGPRLIDIDLLVYDAVRLTTPSLQLPHPRLAERAFVLAPLAEIAPDLRIPGLTRTAAQLLARLPTAPEQAWVVAPPPRVDRGGEGPCCL